MIASAVKVQDTKGAIHLSGRPDPSRRNENFTVNQNYSATLVKS